MQRLVTVLKGKTDRSKKLTGRQKQKVETDRAAGDAMRYSEQKKSSKTIYKKKTLSERPQEKVDRGVFPGGPIKHKGKHEQRKKNVGEERKTKVQNTT